MNYVFREYERPDQSGKIDRGWALDTARALLHYVTDVFAAAREWHLLRGSDSDAEIPFSYEEALPVLAEQFLHRRCSHERSECFEHDNVMPIVWYTQKGRRNKYHGCAVLVDITGVRLPMDTGSGESANVHGGYLPTRITCSKTVDNFWKECIGVTKHVKMKGGATVGTLILDSIVEEAMIRGGGDPLIRSMDIIEEKAGMSYDLRIFYATKDKLKGAVKNRCNAKKKKEGKKDDDMKYQWHPDSTVATEIREALDSRTNVVQKIRDAASKGMSTMLYQRLRLWRERYISCRECFEQSSHGQEFWTSHYLPKLLESLEEKPTASVHEMLDDNIYSIQNHSGEESMSSIGPPSVVEVVPPSPPSPNS